MSGQDKTEKATPHKLREARRNADIPTSPEITGAALALVCLLVLQQQGAQIVQGLSSILSQDLAFAGHPKLVTEATVGARLRSDLITGMSLLAPLALAAMLGALAVGAANTRGLLSLKSIKPSFKKLNPVSGFKHLFGKESLVLLVKVLLKLGLVALVLKNWQSTWDTLVPQLSYMTNASAASTLWKDVLTLAMQLAGVFFAVGVADYFYRQFAWRKRQKMSKEDVKEESKRMEGNQQIRARIRQIGRRRLQALMSGVNTRAVPNADVVITNPTHYAIAIQYTPGKMRAPRVIAKGQRLFAQRIKEVARLHNIPLVENRPLAQALYKSVEVNQEVPAELYKAVAQVLAFVYRLRAPRRPIQPSTNGGPRPGPVGAQP